MTVKQEAVLSSPKQSHGDVRRASSRCPPDSPSAAGTPQKRSLRKTASTLSPRREQGKGTLPLLLPDACCLQRVPNLA